MRIQGRDAVEGGGERVTLVPETLDDLWHLQNIIEPGDLVAGDTTRRIQRADDQLRDTGGQREAMHVTLETESVEFHEFANRLRVGGTIVACSREDQLDAHHTINIEAYDELSIEKDWKPDQYDRLAEAESAGETPEVAVVTVEEGQAWIHTISEYTTSEYATLSGSTGKGEYARDRTELFADLAETLAHLEVDAIILAGPGFTKQDAYKHLEREAPDLVEKITMVDTSAAGDRGVHEVLSRGVLDEVQAETRISHEAAVIDEVTRRIKEEGAVTYGPESVQEAVDYGAVEELLILDERLREERGNRGEWSIDVDDLITSVEQQGGDVTVLSGEYDPGRQLDGLGGIAALLRYRIN